MPRARLRDRAPAASPRARRCPLFPAQLTGVTTEASPAASGGASSGAALARKRYHVGPAARLPRPDMDVRCPFDNGLVDDFDMLTAVTDAGLRALDWGRARDRPLLLVEPAHALRAQREEVLRLAFEAHGAPAAYLARAPVLQAFALGRATALVLDIGASGTRVTGVLDGHWLRSGAVISEVGGTALSLAVLEAATQAGGPAEVVPRALFTKRLVARAGGAGGGGASASASASAAAGGMDVVEGGGGGAPAGGGAPGKPVWEVRPRPEAAFATRSFREAWALEVLDDAKRCLCTVRDTGHVASEPPEERSYELPDGSTLRLGAAREVVPELLFRPGAHARDFDGVLSRPLTQAWHALYAHDVIKRQAPYNHPPSVPQMLYSALMSVHADVRRDLCSSIVLTGGGALLNGLAERLKWETIAAVPAAFRPRIVPAAPVEREFGAWIGGSILASLGTFQQMWISKAEYNDAGAAHVLETRCT